MIVTYNKSKTKIHLAQVKYYTIFNNQLNSYK